MSGPADDAIRLDESCGSVCGNEACHASGANQTACLSDCNSRGQASCGASWLTWQECRVANACDGVFEVQRCQTFEDDYDTCSCDGLVACGEGTFEECEARLGDSTCGTQWSAYSSCLSVSECGFDDCEAQRMTWEACTSGATTVETTCRSTCADESCRAAGADERSCLSDCKDRGEQIWCGDAWLTWQECRVTNTCDGVFDVAMCQPLEDSYVMCSCDSAVACGSTTPEECRARLRDAVCGATWSDYSICLGLADCDPVDCDSEQLSWEACISRAARVESTCRAKCANENCRELGDDEMMCISDCRSKGEDDTCGARWLTWQDCRLANACDGVSEIAACQSLEESWNACAPWFD